jgi:hypothetical protein
MEDKEEPESLLTVGFKSLLPIGGELNRGTG